MQFDIQEFTLPIDPAIATQKNFSFNSGGSGIVPVATIVAAIEQQTIDLTAGFFVISGLLTTMDNNINQLHAFDAPQIITKLGDIENAVNDVTAKLDAVIAAINAHP